MFYIRCSTPLFDVVRILLTSPRPLTNQAFLTYVRCHMTHIGVSFLSISVRNFVPSWRRGVQYYSLSCIFLLTSVRINVQFEFAVRPMGDKRVYRRQRSKILFWILIFVSSHVASLVTVCKLPGRCNIFRRQFRTDYRDTWVPWGSLTHSPRQSSATSNASVGAYKADETRVGGPHTQNRTTSLTQNLAEDATLREKIRTCSKL